MRRRAVLPCLAALQGVAMASGAGAQVVADGSDAVVGKPVAARVLAVVGQRFQGLDPKVSVLRRANETWANETWICGSVDVKNREGLYIGERGFVFDLSNEFFGRVPEGPELLNPKAPGFQALEQIRQVYFSLCLD